MSEEYEKGQIISEKWEITNAIITKATISMGDRGFLDAWLFLDYGDCGVQGFGGYVLYLPKSYAHHKLESVAGHFIFRVLEVAGVESWEDLVGKTIRAKRSWTRVSAIGHIIKDDWFCPEDDFAPLKNRKEAE